MKTHFIESVINIIFLCVVFAFMSCDSAEEEFISQMYQSWLIKSIAFAFGAILTAKMFRLILKWCLPGKNTPSYSSWTAAPLSDRSALSEIVKSTFPNIKIVFFSMWHAVRCNQRFLVQVVCWKHVILPSWWLCSRISALSDKKKKKWFWTQKQHNLNKNEQMCKITLITLLYSRSEVINYICTRAGFFSGQAVGGPHAPIK